MSETKTVRAPRLSTAKFTSEDEQALPSIGELLHELVMDGELDDECGDVNGPGGHWYGLILESGVPGAEYAVVSESEQGFFDYEAFKTPEAARSEFDRISRKLVAFSEAAEERNVGNDLTAKTLFLRRTQ